MSEMCFADSIKKLQISCRHCNRNLRYFRIQVFSSNADSWIFVVSDGPSLHCAAAQVKGHVSAGWEEEEETSSGVAL